MISPSQLIGLTGGIASGKSEAVAYFKQRGYPVINADQLGHKILDPDHEGYQQVLSAFGKNILNPDRTINRSILGELVFNDPQQLQKLNQISHPLISQMIHEQAEQLALTAKDGIIFLEAALLIEANWAQACQSIWIIMADPEVVIKRLKQRNNFTEEQAKARQSAQMSNEERLPYADVLIINNGSVETLHQQLDMALANLLS